MGKTLNESEFQKKLIYWQKKLNLSDWDIEARIERARNMREDCAGTVNWTLTNKQATIKILDPIDYPEDVMGGQDMEKTLIHELLHIHLAPINEDYSEKEHYVLFEEWAINSISEALISLYREGLS